MKICTRAVTSSSLVVALLAALTLLPACGGVNQPRGAGTLPAARVRLGIDVLRETDFAALRGKRVGLVANPASVDGRLVHTADVLFGAKANGVQLVALFGPEHGVYGDEYAGDKVEDKRDARTGLPAFSLYGKTQKPTREMLANVDALVFDLQDIGCRSYTYVSSLRDCLEACAEFDKEFVVLDRPNPLGGRRIEGSLVVDPKLESHVSFIPTIPYIHGMTFGEMAHLIRDQYAPGFKKLSVVKMRGWSREMVWHDTGLKWTPTSPHVPHAEAAYAYPATGILGELYVLQIGVGYTLPFETIAAPWLQAETLADALNKHYQDPGHHYLTKAATRPAAVGELKFPARGWQSSPKGLYFQPIRYKPFYSGHEKTLCQGVHVRIDPKTAENLVEINYRALQALDAPDLFAKAPKRHNMFDKVTGTTKAREMLVAGQDLQPLFDEWRRTCEEFRATRKKWLLY